MWLIQMIVLLLVLSILRSLIPVRHKLLSIFISLLFAIVFSIQLSSVVVTGEIANYRFYENFNFTDVLSVAAFFGTEGFLLALSLILGTFAIHYLSKLFSVKRVRRSISLVLLLLGITILSTSGGIVKNAYDTLSLKFAGDVSFDEALMALNIPANKYVPKDEITASRGKNIIVLSLESMEKGYLGEKLKHLTPNLSRLAQQHTMYTMNQNPGSTWTSGSMYTAITGVPAFFGIHGNSVFQNSYENKLTTLADVLKKAGYNLQYFIGKKEYSGIDDMLTSLGFTVKSEKDFETRYATVDWGIQDLDLFAEFKKEILLKKDSGQPFALFLSTIATHFPNGVPDDRIDSLLPPQKSRLELMASATDYNVADLIEFLNKEELLSNTVFYIYPDHLLMGNKSRVVEDFDERSLYLLTNATPSQTGYPIQEDIYQIDLPKIILAGAEIKHNAAFLTDYVTEKDKNAFLRKNDENLLRLNDAALKTLNCQEGIYVSLDGENGKFIIRNKEDFVVLSNTLPSVGSCQRILFDELLRPVSNYQIDISEVLNPPSAFAYLDLFRTNGMLYGSLKGKYHFGITKRGTDEIIFSKKDLELLDGIDLMREQQRYIQLSSNSWNVKKQSYFTIRGDKVVIPRGLTIIVFNSALEYEYRTFDTYGSIADAAAFVDILQKLKKDNAQYVILAHDSAGKSLTPYSKIFQDLGFPTLSGLKDRQAYIMYNLNGKTDEMVDNTGISHQVLLPSMVKNKVSYFSEPKPDFEPSIDRYIAHAGGMIDGVMYTNSKEALDKSYESGFRYFELDIELTSDGHFVAAHDWKHWAKETNFSGDTPVSRTEFLKHKIRGKYTTLDMEGINKWFANHPDAVLVTDKVNSPARFGKLFVDKSRLIMELFSLPAIREAELNGISVLISELPLSQIQGDVVSYLKAHKVGYVSLSRRNLANKWALLKNLREQDIRVYVYHVNFDSGRDEAYVLENEIGLVYGMYADKWIPAFSENTKQP